MSKSVLLSPHNDDAELFACWHLLREKPHVIVVLRSVVQEQRGGPMAAVREAETAAAMEILGCTWEQWEFGDDWDIETTEDEIHDRLMKRAHHYERCFAPAVEGEETGNYQHDIIGLIACEVFGGVNTTRYLTYTTAGKSEWGTRVPYEPEWVPLKLAALACYRSQAGLANCAAHFVRSQEEYIAP